MENKKRKTLKYIKTRDYEEPAFSQGSLNRFSHK